LKPAGGGWEGGNLVGLAVVSLMVLAVMGALGGLVMARVFASAAARNERRPGGGEDRVERGRAGSADNVEGKRLAGLLIGGATAAMGILTGLLGLATAFSEFTFPNTVVLTSLGIVMGLVGYGVGARRLGVAAAVISAAALIIGVAASQGYVPGVEPADHAMPAQEPRAQ
jgi:hypothetical protein